MTTYSPAVNAGVEALRDRSDAYDPDEEIVVAVLNAAFQNLDDIGFLLFAIDRGSEATVSLRYWSDMPEESRARWRELADGLRMTLTRKHP